MADERYHETLICPTCKRPTTAYVIERREAVENATPRIPARIVLLCARSDCKTPWYINAENADRENDPSGSPNSEPRWPDSTAAE